MTLLKKKFTYDLLTREESSGKRFYLTPDKEMLPSVTTVLDITKSDESKLALENWKKAIGEDKAKKIVTEAASRGTRMHKYLENHINGEQLPESVSNPYAQQSLVMAKEVIKQGFPSVQEVWGSEVPLYYPGLYAGTTDCVGVHTNQPSIIDFKQSNKVKKIEHIDDYFVQLMLYIMAHNRIHNTDIRKGVIMMCVKPNHIGPNQWSRPVYLEFILQPKDFNYWEDQALTRLEQYVKLAQTNA